MPDTGAPLRLRQLPSGPRTDLPACGDLVSGGEEDGPR
jgi:hypothetical protein